MNTDNAPEVINRSIENRSDVYEKIGLTLSLNYWLYTQSSAWISGQIQGANKNFELQHTKDHVF